MSAQLTYKRVLTLTQPGRYFDGGTGLHLLVRSPDKRYWVYRYTHKGKRRDLGLGVFPRVTFAEARKRAQEARVIVDGGECPIKAKATAKAAQVTADAVAITFQAFATDWVASKLPEWRNQKHGEQWLYTLSHFAFPVIGLKALDEIDTEDTLKILQPIWITKTETASRLRGRLERIFSAATTRGLRSGVNPAAWRGHLDTLLPAPRKVSKVAHHSAMPYLELPAFIERLQGRDAMTALALELTILTAARTGEVIGAKRGEVTGDVWIVPAERMKSSRPHRVPLTPRALAIIEAAKACDPDSDYLFSRKGEPLSNMAMVTLLRRMGITVTVHGFRSCFRDWVAEETQHSGEVAEAALAHVIGDKTEAAYRRGDVLQARRKLMLDWEGFCTQTKDKVVQLSSSSFQSFHQLITPPPTSTSSSPASSNSPTPPTTSPPSPATSATTARPSRGTPNAAPCCAQSSTPTTPPIKHWRFLPPYQLLYEIEHVTTARQATSPVPSTLASFFCAQPGLRGSPSHELFWQQRRRLCLRQSWARCSNRREIYIPFSHASQGHGTADGFALTWLGTARSVCGLRRW